MKQYEPINYETSYKKEHNGNSSNTSFPARRDEDSIILKKCGRSTALEPSCICRVVEKGERERPLLREILKSKSNHRTQQGRSNKKDRPWSCHHASRGPSSLPHSTETHAYLLLPSPKPFPYPSLIHLFSGELVFDL